MNYLVDGKPYKFDYQEVKEEHVKFCCMTDAEFLRSLPAAIHLACFICFVKQIPTEHCLIDTGIIHELAHLHHIPDDKPATLKRVRQLFERQLKLA